MGYVHDTSMSQYIPPTLFHFSTATVTYVAGQVAGTIVAHRAAADQTSLITVPIAILSNSVPLKGAYLKSIEMQETGCGLRAVHPAQRRLSQIH